MNYTRMVIETELPEEYGYDRIRYNLSESSISDQKLSDIGLNLPDLTLFTESTVVSAPCANSSPDRMPVFRLTMCW